jgi:hypothetical protein
MERETDLSFAHVLNMVKQLSPLEKVLLIKQVMPDLEASLKNAERRPLESAYGICSDLGVAPSSEEIDEVRRELFENFPREDVA